MTGVFSCPCEFASDSPFCARYRIVLRKGGLLQTFEDIFKTLNILLINEIRKFLVAQSVRTILVIHLEVVGSNPYAYFFF